MFCVYWKGSKCNNYVRKLWFYTTTRKTLVLTVLLHIDFFFDVPQYLFNSKDCETCLQKYCGVVHVRCCESV